MVQLSLQAALFCGKNKVPVAACAAVIAPVGNRGIVSENGVERYLGFILVTQILGPGINLLLSCRIPWHFAAEWVGFFFPPLRAGLHLLPQMAGVRRPTFVLEISEDREKYVSLHPAEGCQTPSPVGHGDRGFVGMMQIPV